MDSDIQNKAKADFGAHLRKLRKQKGLSQEELAFSCDLDRTYIGGIERGERNISLINILKISKALGVPSRELMGGFDD